jgi:hypothetical protein
MQVLNAVTTRTVIVIIIILDKDRSQNCTNLIIQNLCSLSFKFKIFT